MVTSAPSSIQAAIEAACAAEDDRLKQVRAQSQFAGSSRVEVRGASYKEAYHQALVLARRVGRAISFRYNETECFASPDDQWLYA